MKLKNGIKKCKKLLTGRSGFSILFRVSGGQQTTDKYKEFNIPLWGHSSAGRAPALHAGGQGFDSLCLHCPLGHIVL